MIFHADANSFYASCETLFRPDLKGKPVIVLSNNDSIIISLNREAKNAGFKRGEKFSDIKDICKMKKTAVFSSNYTLYADISRRIVSTYVQFAPEVEIYSIDECFLYFPDFNREDMTAAGKDLRDEVSRRVGITISVGIAPTKTLAKFCNAQAKKTTGVFHYRQENLDALLEQTAAADIWGIGWSRAKILQSYGVRNALQLKTYSLAEAKKRFTVCGFNTVLELNGTAAIDRIERNSKKNICCSRQFGVKIYNITHMEEALREYTSDAVARMGEQKSQAQGISVFIATGRHEEEHFFNSGYATLTQPTSYLPVIQNAALQVLRSIYRDGYAYRKVLINLHNLIPQNRQAELFDDVDELKKRESLMQCLQKVNGKYGIRTLTLGAQKYKEYWHMRREFLSPCYTTRMSDLPEVT